ncbi:MAG TPA: histidine kinase dimerization/phosphoacceptor domain -containing protein [Paludibacteraceae bacterium]|nr:histidine kinase dimerization/phosphoacceptor domain -containing protein [Paludibacteraceae bacterium]HPS10218.1 histidine kinase dimerization/phosphoacceptor domain -containing protein [Paludibacteraceae bacterium]
MKYTIRQPKPADYIEYIVHHSLLGIRNSLFALLSLFFIIPLVNYFFFPETGEHHFLLLFWAIIPIALLNLALFSFKKLRERHALYSTIINVLMAVAILLIGIHAKADTPGTSFFSVMVVLIFMGTAAMYRIDFVNFLIADILLLASYITANIINGNFTNNPVFMMNNFLFVLALSVLACIISWEISHLNYRNYIHLKSIEKKNQELQREITLRDEARQNLDASNKIASSVLNSIPDFIFVIDQNLRIVMVNEHIRTIMKQEGITGDPLGKQFNESSKFLSPESVAGITDVFRSKKYSLATYHVEVNGNKYITEARVIPIIKNQVVEQIMIIIRDVTKEREFEEVKLRDAEQKELLLREIHHRVKNNLAIVISMLSLQSRYNPDPVLTGIIQDIELRIRSMALIHEHLYRSDTLDRIPLADYLKSLSAVIASTFQQPHINFETKLEPIDSDIEAALPIGLIVNELLTNAFKYAFPDKRHGNILLELKQLNGEQVELRISDDGIGLPEGFSMEEGSTMGVFMVRLLVEQLYGKLEITNEKGATFRLTYNHKII